MQCQVGVSEHRGTDAANLLRAFLDDTRPYVVFDFDGCVTKDDYLQRAKEFIRLLDTYTEISYSGEGVHLITEGKKPGEYFVVTGSSPPSTSTM